MEVKFRGLPKLMRIMPVCIKKTLLRLQALEDEVKVLRSRSGSPAPSIRGDAGSISPRRLGGPGRDDPPESLRTLQLLLEGGKIPGEVRSKMRWQPFCLSSN